MLIKILGNVLVLLSSSAAGMYLALRDGFRIYDLMQMKKTLEILRSEIEYSRTPLPEAFINISKKVDKPFSTIFEGVATKLAQMDNPGVCHVWKEIFCQHKARTYLAPEDIESIYSFGKTLGYLDSAMQINSIALLESYIDDKTAYLNTISSKNKKMYSSLGILCGILICIVLI